MKNILAFIIALVLVLQVFNVQARKKTGNSFYPSNQPPLLEQPYAALPLGAIKADGWLKKMLESQRDGLTGNIDSVYAEVCGPRNGWLGGDGDVWERGPYWLDGLVPLAFILDDESLKAKAQPWIEWTLESQQEDGYFGPDEDRPYEAGLQRDNSRDWWPKMVMLKVLQQYYSATSDERVLALMTNYFRYQLKMLPDYPLGHWTFWGNRRGGDNLAIVYWLYNITGDKFLLELGELIHRQTYDWTTVFTDNTIRKINPLPSLHCVNVAQGLKEPVIYYQQSKDAKHRQAPLEGLQALKDVHGVVTGMYGGDEQLHGNDPIQGSELCSAVEMMYSFESMLPVTGDMYYADYLEKVAFNALPAQITDDFNGKQYFQQTNQVMVSHNERNFHEDHHARNVFGVLTGYPCCVTNMHQSWPKFTQSLWFATADNGLAALVYSPSTVTAKVGDGSTVSIKESTAYPFQDKISFEVSSSEKVKFPFHLRVPQWCGKPSVLINGDAIDIEVANKVVVINREWTNGDRLELHLPMNIQFSYWYEGSVGIERGPLIYALKMNENWRKVESDDFPNPYYEVTSTDPWNYCLLDHQLKEDAFEIEISDELADMPWNADNAPVVLRTTARRIPSWTLYNNSTGKLPSRSWPPRSHSKTDEEVILIPYGCTALRIAQFPHVRDE